MPRPTEGDLSAYRDLVIDLIKTRREKSADDTQFKRIFTDEIIVEIILAEPKDMMRINNGIMEKLITGFDKIEYDTFFDEKSLTKDLTQPQQDRNLKYKSYNAHSAIFDYDGIISENKRISYLMASNLARNTCTYCNRQYTNTIIAEKKSGEGEKVIFDKISRAQFDHWFSKSKYPLLSLSYFNLIPSCGICNLMKSNIDFQLNTHVHPYIKEANQEFKFNYRHESLKILNVCINGDENNRIMANLRDLKIQQVYDIHSPLELQDLLDLKYKYSENYLKTLLNDAFKTLNLDISEAKRLVFGIETDPVEYHKRAFSKFKNDILDQLEDE